MEETTMKPLLAAISFLISGVFLVDCGSDNINPISPSPYRGIDQDKAMYVLLDNDKDNFTTRAWLHCDTLMVIGERTTQCGGSYGSFPIQERVQLVIENYTPTIDTYLIGAFPPRVHRALAGWSTTFFCGAEVMGIAGSTGTLVITKFDTLHRKISGTFGFTAEGICYGIPGDSATSIEIRASDGRFSAIYDTSAFQ